MSHSVAFTASVAAILAAAFGSADAQQTEQSQVGTLECRGGPDTGFVVGPVTTLKCVLHANSVPDSRYVVAIENFGIKIGDTEVVLNWKVIAPVPWIAADDLVGTYARADGSGSNVLTGGSNGSITLRPPSEQDAADPGDAGIESFAVRPE
jgi:hypothetical protein